MDELPQEIIDKIIDSIHPVIARPSLVTCSLVARRWRWQSQKALFFSPSFRDEAKLEEWNRIVSQNDKLPSYVRHLYWEAPYIHHSFGIEFPARFPFFPNLQLLSISHLSLLSLDDATIEHTFGPLGHSLQSLEIHFLSTDPRKLCLLISLLPHLQSLVSFKVTMEEQPEHGKVIPPFTFAGHIESCNPESTQFFRWVARSRPRLQGIIANRIDSTVIENLNLVVKGCFATLTTITLDSTGCHRTAVAAMVASLDLSSCSNLQTLRIHPSIAIPTALHTIFNTVSSKHFEKFGLGPESDKLVRPHEYDRVFDLFAKRLRELGAVKPLTVVVESWKVKVGRMELDFRSVWPLFSKLGVVEQGYDWNHR